MRRTIIVGGAAAMGLLAPVAAANPLQVTLDSHTFPARCSYTPDHHSEAIERLPCHAVTLGESETTTAVAATFIAPSGRKVTFLGQGDLEATDGVFSVETIERDGRSIVAKGQCTISHTGPKLNEVSCVATAELKLYLGDAVPLPDRNPIK